MNITNETPTNIINAKLTFFDKLGYGSAAYGDAACYSICCTFLLFFITTVADIRPAMAGTIIAIGTIVDAIMNTIMGYLVDNVRTKWGRRVPFIFVFGIMLFFTTLLLFTGIKATYPIRIAYYTIMVMLFWISYTAFFVPYLAMGADFTQDYEERTTLRSFAAFFNMLGSLTAMVVPTAMVGLLNNHGIETSRAWTITAGAIGLVASISIIITAITARKYDIPDTTKILKAPRLSIGGMFSQYWQVLKLKPIKWLLLTSLFFLISYSVFLSDMLYYFTYNMGINSGRISFLLLIRCLVGIAIIPLVNKVCALTDKRTALIIFQIVCAVAIAVSKFTGIGEGFRLYIFIALLGTATVTYWQIMPAIIYDVCEYDELHTGMRRQGTIVSIQGLVEAISSGIGAQILGIILQFARFDAAQTVQSHVTLLWIENCITIIPTIFLLMSCITLRKYPISKKVYEDICRQLQKIK